MSITSVGNNLLPLTKTPPSPPLAQSPPAQTVHEGHHHHGGGKPPASTDSGTSTITGETDTSLDQLA